MENGLSLTLVLSFKYLGITLMASDYDWKVVVVNLRKARKKWARMWRILRREGSNTRVLNNFFKDVVQAVLLFGSL